MGKSKLLAFKFRCFFDAAVLFCIFFFICQSLHAQVGGAERTIGAGIVYPAPTQALVVNPASLQEGKRITAEAMWRAKIDKPFAAFHYTRSGAGLGVDYRQEPKFVSGSPTIYQGGGALLLRSLAVGATVRKVTKQDLDTDLGAYYDMGNLRIASVLRSVKDKANRIDIGVGLGGESLYASINFKHNIPWTQASDNYLVDVAAAANVNWISFGVGYYMIHNGNQGFVSTKVHAGASFKLENDMTLTASYLPLYQEWVISDDTYSVGFNYRF